MLRSAIGEQTNQRHILIKPQYEASLVYWNIQSPARASINANILAASDTNESRCRPKLGNLGAKGQLHVARPPARSTSSTSKLAPPTCPMHLLQRRPINIRTTPKRPLTLCHHTSRYDTSKVPSMAIQRDIVLPSATQAGLFTPIMRAGLRP